MSSHGCNHPSTVLDPEIVTKVIRVERGQYIRSFTLAGHVDYVSSVEDLRYCLPRLFSMMSRIAKVCIVVAPSVS